ncbi:MAG: 30S ribosome-binding factor RbfA [Candidatus Schekmanbacteria bacterium]|nr:30S ribosome-binding factor RbfA [Candidatus Schekmanbacteria bacterium]
MSSRRTGRLNVLFREEISTIILREVKDPRIGFVTITSVDVSADLSLAKIYFSAITEESNREKIVKGLQSAAPFIRSSLKKKLSLKRIPMLEFIYDMSLEYGDRIDKILKNLKDEDSEG